MLNEVKRLLKYPCISIELFRYAQHNSALAARIQLTYKKPPPLPGTKAALRGTTPIRQRMRTLSSLYAITGAPEADYSPKC